MAKIIRLDHHAAHFTSRRKPRWIATVRQLWCNGRLVKQFKRSAPCQELILTAFEEEHSPQYIDDPLPATKTSMPSVACTMPSSFSTGITLFEPCPFTATAAAKECCGEL
ncbi:MAG: hypothetical protein ACJ8FY_16270 [Gemmataceae bacterium]